MEVTIANMTYDWSCSKDGSIAGVQLNTVTMAILVPVNGEAFRSSIVSTSTWGSLEIGTHTSVP